MIKKKMTPEQILSIMKDLYECGDKEAGDAILQLTNTVMALAAKNRIDRAFTPSTREIDIDHAPEACAHIRRLIAAGKKAADPEHPNNWKGFLKKAENAEIFMKRIGQPVTTIATGGERYEA